MTPEVEQAIAELERAFPDHRVRVLEEPQGGAYVRVEDLELGDGYVPPTSWIGFLIPYDYPRSQVYPFFLRPDLARANGQPFQPPINAGQTMPGFDEPAVMASRSSQRWNPARDTAALKLMRVLEWLRERET